jgi:hypothetical protein
MWRGRSSGAEPPRPPGWKPAPQPPPGPAASSVAPVTAPPPAPRPAPKPAPAAAAPPAPVPPPARRTWLFPVLTLGFGIDTLVKASTLLGVRASDLVEATLHGVYLGSAGAGAVLTIGLARGERWLPRAAVIWAATAVARYAIEALGWAGDYGVRSFSSFFFSSAVLVCVALYIQRRARKLGLLS